MTKHTGLVRMRSNDIVTGIKYVEEGINLCRLPSGLICIGCCGFDFAKNLSDKEQFNIALEKNTEEYIKSKDKMEFKKLYDPEDLHDCGLCRKLIITKLGDKHLQITCPLHPSENGGIDLRAGECDSAFMCETQRLFLKNWTQNIKEKFLKFIEEKDLDWFEYSKRMHDNSLLVEFYSNLTKNT